MSKLGWACRRYSNVEITFRQAHARVHKILYPDSGRKRRGYPRDAGPVEYKNMEVISYHMSRSAKYQFEEAESLHPPPGDCDGSRLASRDCPRAVVKLLSATNPCVCSALPLMTPIRESSDADPTCILLPLSDSEFIILSDSIQKGKQYSLRHVCTPERIQSHELQTIKIISYAPSVLVVPVLKTAELCVRIDLCNGVVIDLCPSNSYVNDGCITVIDPRIIKNMEYDCRCTIVNPSCHIQQSLYAIRNGVLNFKVRKNSCLTSCEENISLESSDHLLPVCKRPRLSYFSILDYIAFNYSRLSYHNLDLSRVHTAFQYIEETNLPVLVPAYGLQPSKGIAIAFWHNYLGELQRELVITTSVLTNIEDLSLAVLREYIPPSIDLFNKIQRGDHDDTLYHSRLLAGRNLKARLLPLQALIRFVQCLISFFGENYAYSVIEYNVIDKLRRLPICLPAGSLHPAEFRMLTQNWCASIKNWLDDNIGYMHDSIHIILAQSISRILVSRVFDATMSSTDNFLQLLINWDDMIKQEHVIPPLIIEGCFVRAFRNRGDTTRHVWVNCTLVTTSACLQIRDEAHKCVMIPLHYISRFYVERALGQSTVIVVPSSEGIQRLSALSWPFGSQTSISLGSVPRDDSPNPTDYSKGETIVNPLAIDIPKEYLTILLASLSTNSLKKVSPVTTPAVPLAQPVTKSTDSASPVLPSLSEGEHKMIPIYSGPYTFCGTAVFQDMYQRIVYEGEIQCGYRSRGSAYIYAYKSLEWTCHGDFNPRDSYVTIERRALTTTDSSFVLYSYTGPLEPIPFQTLTPEECRRLCDGELFNDDTAVSKIQFEATVEKLVQESVYDKLNLQLLVNDKVLKSSIELLLPYMKEYGHAYAMMSIHFRVLITIYPSVYDRFLLINARRGTWKFIPRELALASLIARSNKQSPPVQPPDDRTWVDLDDTDGVLLSFELTDRGPHTRAPFEEQRTSHTKNTPLSCTIVFMMNKTACIYTGTIKAGKFHGRGLIRKSGTNQLLFDGFWQAGQPHGPCSFSVISEAYHYVGTYDNGSRQGIGQVIESKSGTMIHFGYWKNNIPHNRGFQTSNGGRYEGDFKAGRRDGLGIYSALDDISWYSGGWMNDKPHGSGFIVTKNELIQPVNVIHGNVQKGRGTDGTITEAAIEQIFPFCNASPDFSQLWNIHQNVELSRSIGLAIDQLHTEVAS